MKEERESVLSTEKTEPFAPPFDSLGRPSGSLDPYLNEQGINPRDSIEDSDGSN